MLEFRVLGPVEARREGRILELKSRKMRAMLAALLLRADHMVATDHLVAALWGENPPVTAAAQLHKYVSRLRALLGADCIVRAGTGYKLRLLDNYFDLRVFDQLVGSARAALAAGRPAEAAEQIGAALALWRGEAIADTTEELVRDEARALEERRMAARLDQLEIGLAQGRHAELVGEVQALLNRDPLNERLRGHLMVALQGSGRVGEALAAYHEGRTMLVDELGIDPGAELQRLHEAILVGNPVRRPPPRPPSAPAATGSPAQLPPSIADFTGRAEWVAQICAELTTNNGDAPAIVAISGKGGVGKSTLAVRAARRVLEAFADGQLYLRLRGTGAEPVDPLNALRRFLRALGIEDWAIPETADECAELFRSLSTGRRILLVLDDVADEAQIRQLLPGSPTCAVLITSRPRLSGLEGASFHDLDVFSTAESVELLRRIVGAQRLDGDLPSAHKIVRLCANLPLAVRVAAARLAHHDRVDLARFARRLADRQRRLDVLVAGDLEVRASLALGRQGLSHAEKRAFGLLGLLDTPDFAAWVVAPLLGVAVDVAEDIVESLVKAQLLDIAGSDAAGQTRYRYHDLVKLYARECVEAELTEGQRRAAITRVLGSWLTLATEAGERLYGTRFRGWSPRSYGATAYFNPFGPHDIDELLSSPLAWFESEQSALTACVAQAHTEGLSSSAWLLAEGMTEFLEIRHKYGDWEWAHSRALDVCSAKGDRVGVAVMLIRLARLRFIRKDPVACLELARRAIVVLEEIGEKVIEAEAAVIEAAAVRKTGDYQQALSLVDRAVLRARAGANGVAEVRAIRELAEIRYELGDWLPATEAFEMAAAMARRLDNRREEALSLRSLAVVLRSRDELDRARGLIESALTVFRELGDRPYEAFSCLTLGMILLRLDDPSAGRFIGQGRAMLNEMNLGFGVGEALYVQAALDLADGRPREALDQLHDSIRILMMDPVHPVLIAAVDLLATTLRALGEHSSARAVEQLSGTLSTLVGEQAPPGILHCGTAHLRCA